MVFDAGFGQHDAGEIEHVDGAVVEIVGFRRPADQKEERMARIPIDRAAIPDIGRAFGEAANDSAKREAFRTDPAAYLRSCGVSEDSLAGLKIVLHEDDESTLHVVLPSQVDADRLAAQDEDYLKMLGTMALLGCCRPVR